MTLSTDFGTRDPYTAELKGVLYRDGPPDLLVVDLSHDLPAYDVRSAAWFVRAAIPRFPRGTVHVVVVDPGVGSARQPLIAELDGQLLVGPDNGVFGLLFDGREQAYVIDPERLGTTHLSSTFHGRDLFAPAAARLAAGLPCAALGVPAAQGYQRLALPPLVYSEQACIGQVVHIDHYGNLITNMRREDLQGCVESAGARIEVAGQSLEGLLDHYAQATKGALLALVGSSGFLEIAVREGSAAQKLGGERGTPVRVSKRS